MCITSAGRKGLAQFALTHSYEPASNRTERYNTTATLAWSHWHEEFGYVGLHRVEEAKRGVRGGGFTYSSTHHSPLDESLLDHMLFGRTGSSRCEAALPMDHRRSFAMKERRAVLGGVYG